MKSVREIRPGDKMKWLSLWRGYIEFYQANISEEQYKLIWGRLLDDSYNLHGLVVEDGGDVLGLTHYSFQTSSWAKNNYCYLEDLFVQPDQRGGGLGRSLIDAVHAIALENGSSRLYWNTDATNETARKLYDSYSRESGKVQYRIQLNA
jgi:GNAT superfamily N-acetyltransferase